MANKFNIKTLHNNFDMLRKRAHLSKGEFCKLIGIVNVYRTDYSSIGAKLLKGISDHFPDIDENWLLIPHDEKELHVVAEPQPSYGGAQKLRRITDGAPIKISELLHKAAVVLESETVYKAALTNNIEAFHYAMTCEETLGLANKRIDGMEEQILEIKKRLPAVGE